MLELCYTSVPKGIRPGSSGYTTVAYTKDLPAALLQRLEGLSTFDHVDKNAAAYARNPVNHAHLAFGSGQQRMHVISRIAACEPDHSGRTNYFAHHVLLTEPQSRSVPAGPAAVAAGESLFMRSWKGEPRLLPARSLPLVVDAGSADGAAWRAAGLDPGWAAFLADRVQQRGKPAYVICPMRIDALALIADVLAAVPEEERWNVTFATHATAGFPGLGVDCQLRFVVADTPYAAEAKAKHRADCIDLTTRPAAPDVPTRAAAEATPSGGAPRGPLPRSGDRTARTLSRPPAAGEADPSQQPGISIGERRTFVVPEAPARRSVAAWIFAASTVVATCAAGFFAYDASRWRAQFDDQEKTVRAKEAEIKKLKKLVAAGETTDTGVAEGTKPVQTAPTEDEGSAPDTEPEEAADARAHAGPPASAEEPDTASGGEPNKASQQAAAPIFLTAQDRARTAKRDGSIVDMPVLKALRTKDVITIAIRRGAAVVDCEILATASNKKWEVKERSGTSKKTLATFIRKDDKLLLSVPSSAKSPLIGLVTLVVSVKPAAGGEEKTYEFSPVDPITALVSLTPAEPKGAALDKIRVEDFSQSLYLFGDNPSSDRFEKLLAAVPSHELHVEFKGDQFAGVVERDGSQQHLVIKPLTKPDGTPCVVNKYEICGISLRALGGDRKAPKEPLFRLDGWWIQDFDSKGTPAHRDRGIRLPRDWKDDAVLGPLKDYAAKTEQTLESKKQAAADKNNTAPNKQEEMTQAWDAHNKATGAVNDCETYLPKIRHIQAELTLQHFQNIPVRITLRRAGVDDEIVIVDSAE